MVMGRHWLWPALVVAVMLGGGWAVDCPVEVCSCNLQRDQLVANCFSLPNNGGKVVNLTLSPNGDTKLRLLNGQFNSFKHLKYLTLRNTSIYEIQNKTFHGANETVEIDLSFNNIEELDPTVFMDLDKLTRVSLRGNPIDLVQEAPFLISESITHLDIGECKIKNIPGRIFYGLKRLTHLTLDGNLIESIEFNVLPKELKYLDLANNHIKNVQSKVIFSALPNLKSLSLAGNPIKCSCSLVNLIKRYNSSVVEDDLICSSHKYSKESCLVEVKEPKHSNFNFIESEQADEPVPETSMENNNTLAITEMMENEKAKNENQDNNKVIEPSEDPDENHKNIATDTSGNIDDQTTSNEPSDSTYNVNTYSTTSEAADINDLHSQNNISEIGTDDKVTGNERFSTTVIPDDILESSTEVTETSGKADAHTNINDPDHQLQSLQLNVSNTVEYDGKDSQEEDLQKGGFILSVTSEKSQVDTNNTSSESITNGEFEERIDEFSGQGPNDLFEGDNLNQSITSTTDISNSPIDEKPEEDEERETESSSKGTEHVSESELTNDLTSIVTTENEHPEATESPTHIIKSVNEQLSPVVGTTEFTTYETPINQTEILEETKVVKSRERQEKIQEMVGAEVVMFCVAIIIICLVLFSIYKCRSSKNRQSMNIKDLESNRGTELQDMASLLPKPEEKDEKKNNLKYEDKAPSSETVKLLTEQNENDNSNFIPVTETRNKPEDKNSLNNNTPSSKVPLLKPEKPVIISSNAPIQRTKVKVGIIPDSIPRTPIFLQKTYNGTKNV